MSVMPVVSDDKVKSVELLLSLVVTEPSVLDTPGELVKTVPLPPEGKLEGGPEVNGNGGTVVVSFSQRRIN